MCILGTKIHVAHSAEFFDNDWKLQIKRGSECKRAEKNPQDTEYVSYTEFLPVSCVCCLALGDFWELSNFDLLIVCGHLVFLMTQYSSAFKMAMELEQRAQSSLFCVRIKMAAL